MGTHNVAWEAVSPAMLLPPTIRPLSLMAKTLTPSRRERQVPPYRLRRSRRTRAEPGRRSRKDGQQPHPSRSRPRRRSHRRRVCPGRASRRSPSTRTHATAPRPSGCCPRPDRGRSRPQQVPISAEGPEVHRSASLACLPMHFAVDPMSAARNGYWRRKRRR